MLDETLRDLKDRDEDTKILQDPHTMDLFDSEIEDDAVSRLIEENANLKTEQKESKINSEYYKHLRQKCKDYEAIIEDYKYEIDFLRDTIDSMGKAIRILEYKTPMTQSRKKPGKQSQSYYYY